MNREDINVGDRLRLTRVSPADSTTTEGVEGVVISIGDENEQVVIIDSTDGELSTPWDNITEVELLESGPSGDEGQGEDSDEHPDALDQVWDDLEPGQQVRVRYGDERYGGEVHGDLDQLGRDLDGKFIVVLLDEDGLSELRLDAGSISSISILSVSDEIVG
jgi:hypothetical protein